MAIAYDATSGAARAWVTSDSFLHTCTGDDRLLLVWVFFDRGNGIYNVSSMTYAGAALSLHASVQDGTRSWELWRLVGPASGTNTLSATYNNTGPTAKVLIRALSYTGVDSDLPLGSVTSNSNSVGTTASVVVSSASGEVVADCVWVFSSGQNIVVGANQTSRAEVDSATIGYGALGWSDEAGAASVTMSWTLSTDAWHIIGVPIKPAGGAAAGVSKTTKQTLLGVG